MAHIYVQCKRTLTRNRYHREMLRPSVFASPKVCSDLLTCVTTSAVPCMHPTLRRLGASHPYFFSPRSTQHTQLNRFSDAFLTPEALPEHYLRVRSASRLRPLSLVRLPRPEARNKPGTVRPLPRPALSRPPSLAARGQGRARGRVPRCRPRTRWRRRPKHKLQAKRASLGPPPPTQAEQRVAGVEAGVLTKPRTAS